MCGNQLNNIMATKFKLGQTAPKSGQYLEVGPKGGPKKEISLPTCEIGNS